MFRGYFGIAKRTVGLAMIVALIVSFWLWHTTPAVETSVTALVSCKYSDTIEFFRQPVFTTHILLIRVNGEDWEREVRVDKTIYDSLSEGNTLSAIIYTRYNGSSKIKIISKTTGVLVNNNRIPRD